MPRTCGSPSPSWPSSRLWRSRWRSCCASPPFRGTRDRPATPQRRQPRKALCSSTPFRRHRTYGAAMRTNYSVIVVGAGFAGIEAATRLSRRGVRVLLIDRNSYHQFQPLLYQVATAQLGVSDVARPIRSITHRRRWVDVLYSEVTSVDAAERTVTTIDGRVFRSRILVIASGAEANFFNTPGAEEFAYPLYSVGDSVDLGGRLVELLELANLDPAGGDVNVVVVGGGPTGVETAGALAETVKYVVPEYYSPELAERCRVYLVDMVPNVLSAFNEQN